jgi:photosystem II stability/assembly factor-like uncharacterized protein
VRRRPVPSRPPSQPVSADRSSCPGSPHGPGGRRCGLRGVVPALLGFLLLVGCGSPSGAARGAALPSGFQPEALLVLTVRTGLALSTVGVGEGTRLVVAATADGGRTWRRALEVTARTTGPFGLVACGSRAVALAGEPGVLDVSLDQGRRWRTVPLPGQATLVSLPGPRLWFAIGDVVGAAGTETGTLYRSVDGGRHWRRVGRIPAVGDITGLGFRDARVGWVGLHVAGGPPRILATQDGGRRWSVAALPPSRGPTTPDTLPPTFAGPVGVLPLVAGGSPAKVELAVSNDGGRSWPMRVALPAGTAWGVTRTGVAWVAEPDGRLWLGGLGRPGRAERLPGAVAVLAVDFLDARRGWAAVAVPGGYRVLRTADGGITWTRP